MKERVNHFVLNLINQIALINQDVHFWWIDVLNLVHVIVIYRVQMNYVKTYLNSVLQMERNVQRLVYVLIIRQQYHVNKIQKGTIVIGRMIIVQRVQIVDNCQKH